MKQLTEQEAINYYVSKKWEKLSNKEIVDLQLYQELLCVPFSKFHEAMESVLERPIFTHEFAFIDNLKSEYERKN